MRTLYGVYRAVCLGVDPEAVVVRCQVPQVFADETVTCYDIIGGAPLAGDLGWVSFESGYPDRPVWMSGVSGDGTSSSGGGVFTTRGYRWINQTAETDPGHGKVKVNNADPALATKVFLSLYDMDGTAFIMTTTLKTGDLIAIYLNGDIQTRIEYVLSGTLINNGGEWASIPVSVVNNYGFRSGVPGNNAAVEVALQPSTGGSGGGGGTNEVWIGPSDPIVLNPSIELWFDSDAPSTDGGGGGGGGTNEVWVGTDDPIAANPTIELWYDTDEPAILADDLRWNTAWGVVATAVRTSQSASTGTTVVDTGISVTFAPVVGRRYSIAFEGLAVVSAAGNVCNANITDAANVTVQGGGASPGVPNTGHSLIVVGFVEPLVATPLTYKVRHFVTGTGTCYVYADVNSSMRMFVTDLGPTSLFAPLPNPVPAWTPLTPYFQNGWVDYAAPYGPAFYRKLGDMVYLRGLVQSGSPANSIVCTLPIGYRPPYETIIVVACYQGIAEIRVATSGTVTVSSFVPTTAPIANPPTWLTLSGVMFSVTP